MPQGTKGISAPVSFNARWRQRGHALPPPRRTEYESVSKTAGTWKNGAARTRQPPHHGADGFSQCGFQRLYHGQRAGILQGPVERRAQHGHCRVYRNGRRPLPGRRQRHVPLRQRPGDRDGPPRVLHQGPGSRRDPAALSHRAPDLPRGPEGIPRTVHDVRDAGRHPPVPDPRPYDRGNQPDHRRLCQGRVESEDGRI